MKKTSIILLLSLLCTALHIRAGNENVSKVHIIFKTHLDIGFTDLSSVVEQRYIREFIPKAMDVAEELRKAGGEERYVWTTGSWLIQSFLDQASPEQKKRLETAIKEGDIVWNSMPYTVESESMSKAQFQTILQLSKQLDREYGKETIGAKMTDVPGHTRGIVPLLAQAGVRFLHIGVNPASTVPFVPDICRWRDPSGKEIILMYQKDYGSDIILPDGKTAMVVAFTGDNHGPHSAGKVKEIYASLHKNYPNARLVASTLSDVAGDLETIKEQLPVFTGEIGDTWIYGYGSSPIRMACFRELSRLYDQWIVAGKIDPSSDDAIHFMIRLGLIAEHTWGFDVKTHIRNWDKYDFDKFQEARKLPEFQRADLSWKELSDNIDKAVAFLPDFLQKEANDALEGIKHPFCPVVKKNIHPKKVAEDGSVTFSAGNVNMIAGELAYQTYSESDYQPFFKNYMTHPFEWAFQDFGKPGLEKTGAQSATIKPIVIAGVEKKNETTCQLAFPQDERIDSRVLPEKLFCSYRLVPGEQSAELSVTLINKPANRLPEAYWFSFYPKDVISVLVEKTGQMVDVLDVVEGGNRQMHGIDHYVDVKTNAGTIRITSMDAFLAGIGERSLLNYSLQQPDISKGIHFCLYNNAWGTNFSQWFEGSITYRFKIEIL